nr:rod-binding protein [Geobacter sp. OR-1]
MKTISPDTLGSTMQTPRNAVGKAAGAEPDAKTRAAAHKVATEFEAMFAGMMVKSMRSSSTPDKLTGGGHGEEVFQSLLDQEYASAIAKQGGLGIAKTIEKQLLDDARRHLPATGRRNNGSTP